MCWTGGVGLLNIILYRKIVREFLLVVYTCENSVLRRVFAPKEGRGDGRMEEVTQRGAE
jgi:hypothetical protein